MSFNAVGVGGGPRFIFSDFLFSKPVQLRTCLEILKANDVDVNALEEKTHQPGHALAEIKLPFDSEGNRVN